MIQRYRAWHKMFKEIGQVKRIRFDDDGNVSTVLFKGKDFGANAHVDEIELMQSTGLLDKNGKEIFEGDVVDYNGRKAIVNWHSSYASFIYRFVDELHKRNAEWNPLYLAYYHFEVVGNKFENPELLEVTE